MLNRSMYFGICPGEQTLMGALVQHGGSMCHILEGAFFFFFSLHPEAVSQVSESLPAVEFVQQLLPNFSSIWQLQPPLYRRAACGPHGGPWLSGSLELSPLNGTHRRFGSSRALPAAVLCWVGGFAKYTWPLCF